MIIAFEGPDKAGKTTSANNVEEGFSPTYNLEERDYKTLQKHHIRNPDSVLAVDRVAWITHMVYRLALPDHIWENHNSGYSVFPMPDAHLVFKNHDVVYSSLGKRPQGELYRPVEQVKVDRFYRRFSTQLMRMNEMTNFSLFKSVTVMNVKSTGENYFSQVVEHSSPHLHLTATELKSVDSDLKLKKLLERV